MIRFVFLSALALSACATVDVRSVPGPGGEQVYQATCYDEGLAPCMEKAASICRGEYHLLHDSAESRPVMLSGGLLVSSTANRLLFKCGKAEVAH
jgi:hypothetical protein